MKLVYELAMGKKELQYPDENFIYYKYINYTEGRALEFHGHKSVRDPPLSVSMDKNSKPQKISLSKKNMAKDTVKRY